MVIYLMAAVNPREDIQIQCGCALKPTLCVANGALTVGDDIQMACGGCSGAITKVLNTAQENGEAF